MSYIELLELKARQIAPWQDLLRTSLEDDLLLADVVKVTCGEPSTSRPADLPPA
jgi:hypothetical protein